MRDGCWYRKSRIARGRSKRIVARGIARASRGTHVGPVDGRSSGIRIRGWGSHKPRCRMRMAPPPEEHGRDLTTGEILKKKCKGNDQDKSTQGW